MKHYLISGLLLLISGLYAIPASVRIGNQLCPEEAAYRQKRAVKVNTALSAQLDLPMPQPATPCIAVCCSGGGYRAMLYSIGALAGAERNGLLDTFTYLVGLSGSTWSIGSWMSSQKSAQEKRDDLVLIATHGFNDFNWNDAWELEKSLVHKSHFNQPVGIVDIYGGLLASELLKEFGADKYQVFLSAQQTRINDGSLPLPIYTAARGDLPSITSEGMDYEFTPYEIGAWWLGAYVPSSAYGCRFANGTSFDNAPEQSFSTILATCGLAFGLTFADLARDINLENMIQSSIIKDLIHVIVTSTLGNQRFCAAEVYNFTRGMMQSPLAQRGYLDLIDAGIEYNLPYQCISGQRPERKADIIIFLDASEGTTGQELQCIAQFAQNHQLPFPAISLNNVATQAVSIFKDENNLDCPVVIYIPTITDDSLFIQFMNDPYYGPLIQQLNMFNIQQCINSGDCGTLNLKYTLLNAQRIALLGELNMQFAQPAIQQVARDLIMRRIDQI